jgi:hypothetical protein
MTTASFFGSYVAKPVVESRFGWIPVGMQTVTVTDIKEILASQDVHLDDDGKIVVDAKPKDKFNKVFDQNILCLVYSDEENRKLIDRRSSKGWLSNDEASATPEMIQKYGLKTEGNRFSMKGIGVPSAKKTESALAYVDRLCGATGVTNPLQVIGKDLKIEVVEVEFEGKKNREVKSYHSLDSTAVVATPKATPAPIVDELPEDLPF